MKKNNINIIFFILLIFLFKNALSQLYYEFPKDPDRLFSIGAYPQALEKYIKRLSSSPNNIKLHYKIAICYLKIYNFDKAKEEFDFLLKNKNAPKETLYYLARYYHLNNDFEKAIEYYNKYKEEAKGALDYIKMVDKNIEECKNGKELKKYPIDIDYKNLGPYVNSAWPDFNPFVTPDEKKLFFTTKREGTTGRIFDSDGNYSADIFIVPKLNKLNKVRKMGYPNTYGNEETAGMSEKGTYVFFHLDNPNVKSDIYYSKKGKRSYKKAEPLKLINTNHREVSACSSENFNIIFFASDRPGGYGGLDIYQIKKLPDGNWGKPYNLGPVINTEYDDNYPMLVDSGKTLFFSSKGHTSMGGYDIFKSIYDTTQLKWGFPQNLGYPINTGDDDMTISFTLNKRYAYVTRYRKDSYGNKDIYKITFKSIEPDYTVITGKVLGPDSNIINNDLIIDIYYENNNELYGTYTVNPETGKYVFILPPGEYVMIINGAEEFENFTQKIIIDERNYLQPFIKRNIYLKNIFGNEN